jgi:tRNA dimethylallyltransferase
MNREKLYKRIDQRVESMFAKGLGHEAKKLLRSKLSKTACYAIGIKELRGFFNGEYDLEKTKYLIKRNTRHYAKRQLTWFRKDKRIKWVEIGEKETPLSVARSIFLRL